MCIWQPLLAAELFIMEQLDAIEDRTIMERKGENINISFSPGAPNTIGDKSEQVETTSSNISPATSSEKQSFGPRPDVYAADFDFQTEISHLPFILNMGIEENMTHNQHSWFINLIYEVFSLHDEHFSFCDKIKHTIPTTSDRHVYLTHHTIPPQLKREMCKCLDTWLRQGIIRPFQSPYASPVVIV